MHPMPLRLGLVSVFLIAGVASAHAQSIDQKRAFGTITRGSTVCVGPLSPSDSHGVQIFGFTNGAQAMTWQVFRVNSQSAPALVFQTTARFVDKVVTPQSNFLFHACVVKRANAAQDFDLTLNSQRLE